MAPELENTDMTLSKPLYVGKIALLLACMALPFAASADDGELRMLREQIAALSQRLDQLEASNRELQSTNESLAAADRDNAAAVVAVSEKTEAAMADWEGQATKASWADSLRWKGDFRYRFENIDIEGRDDRNRSRIRARTALVANISSDLEVGVGMASGSEDPVSSNQTLGGGGSSKDLRLDLAYFDWSGLDNTHLIGGKFKNIVKPSGKNSMLWDSDWRPEGLAFTWDNDRFFAGGVGTWLESDSNKGNNFAWIAEAGMKFRVGDNVKMRFGLGYHEFDTAGRKSVFGDGDFFGNSFVGAGSDAVYANNYHGVQAFGEVGFEVAEMPLLAYFDYVQNQEASEFDTGYIFGLKLGSAAAPGSWDIAWAYEDLEADAALGLLVDSDFGGGGTDARGHIFKGTYAIRKNLSTKITYVVNEIDGDLGSEKDFNRLMLDLAFKF